MQRKIFTTAIFLLCLTVRILPGQGIASVKEVVADGARLQARGNIIPYQSRAAAIEGAASEYVVGIQDWETRQAEEYVKCSGRFKIPAALEGRSVVLRVEDVASSFEVELNGAPVGYSQSAMGRIEFDLTPFVQPFYNEVSLVIYKNAVGRRIEAPDDSDGEAFREAMILLQPAVRVRDVIVDTYVAGNGSGLFSLGVVMKSHLRNSKDYTISYELLAPDGSVVLSGSRDLVTGWMSEDTVRFAANIPDVKPWNHETPYLYTLLVQTRHMGRDAEFVPIKVGFRSAEHDKGMLYVNGKRVLLAGRRAGYVINDTITNRNLTRLKQEGVTAVLVDGRPQPDAFYDMCDRLGLYVCDMSGVNTSSCPSEITVGGNPSNDPAWAEAYLDRVMRMYYSSRNHPSVVMFIPAEASVNGYCLYESYLALKATGDSRPVVYFDGGGQWNSDDVDINLYASLDNQEQAVIVGEVHKGEGRFGIMNALELTSLKGFATYSIRQGKQVVHSGFSPLDIPIGEMQMVAVRAPEMAKAKKDRSVEVNVYVPDPLYHHGRSGAYAGKGQKSSKGMPSLEGMRLAASETYTY